MLAPLKWLLSYTDLKINTKEEIHELASEMTLTGTKVEEVVSKGERNRPGSRGEMPRGQKT